jgi:hypothetical protein
MYEEPMVEPDFGRTQRAVFMWVCGAACSSRPELFAPSRRDTGRRATKTSP